MSYEELVEYLKICCIEDIPVSITSVLNTIDQSDDICVNFITVIKNDQVMSDWILYQKWLK